MPTTAWPALGTALAYSTDAGSTWLTVGQVISISHGGGGEVGKRDTTVLASSAKTYAPTIPDNGEVSFELNWDPTDTQHKQLATWKNAPTTTLPLWKITWTATTSTSTFNAFVSNLDGPNAGGVDENVTMTVTLQVSGTITNSP
jgi:hypothetical protein